MVNIIKILNSTFYMIFFWVVNFNCNVYHMYDLFDDVILPKNNCCLERKRRAYDAPKTPNNRSTTNFGGKLIYLVHTYIV